MNTYLLFIFVTIISVPFQALAAVLSARTVDGFVGQGDVTGGGGANTIRVSTLDDLISAVQGDDKKTVILTASLSGKTAVRIGSNTSLFGANGKITLNGIGLRVLGKTNVIIRNLKIQKVVASAGDAIAIQESSKVWVDHVDLSSERIADKDYYDGLLDITHGSTQVTVSWSKFSNHCKASLVGHNDNNCEEDDKITATYHHNYWTNINSRLPSFRCGHGHIFNNYYENSSCGIETRIHAQLQIENNVFSNVDKPVFADKGYACLVGNDLGGKDSTVPEGQCFKPEYRYSLDPTSNVKNIVTNAAGATLTF